MRPPVHMPLPAITSAPFGMRLIAIDSSAVRQSLQVRQRRQAAQPGAPGLRFLVEELGVLPVHLGGLDRHRAVEEHLPVGELPRVEVHGELVEDLLAAADREGRDQHVAAVAARGAQDLAELLEGRLARRGAGGRRRCSP